MSISFSCRNWHRVINAQKSTETYCEGNIRLTTSRLANKRPWSLPSARGGAGRLAAPILPITPNFGWTVWRVFIDRWRNDSLVAGQVLFFSSQWYRTNGGREENPDIMSSSRGQCLCFEWMFIQLWSLIPPLKKKCFNVHIHKIHGYCFKYKQYLREGKNTWQGNFFIHTIFL